jgi:hypothetical protein
VSVYRLRDAGGDGYRRGSGEMRPTINLERRASGPMIKQNPLDFLGVSPPNGRDFPTRPSGSGRFSDDLSFDSQRSSPRWRKLWIGFRRFVGRCASQFSAVFVHEMASRAEEAHGMSPTRPERFDRPPVGPCEGGRADAVRRGVLQEVDTYISCSCRGVPQRVALRGSY